MTFKILSPAFLEAYTNYIKESPLVQLDNLKKVDLSVDYFEFYKSVSSVYSSKIEGEDVDFDSYYKHKFLNIKFKDTYTAKADDLYNAYDFIENKNLTLNNLKKAHAILSNNLLPKSQQGFIRSNPMFVINSEDKIEYIAASPDIVNEELNKLFYDLKLLLDKDLSAFEIFYYAAFTHLVFVKIHPFQDGNGRTGRLLEKWFLLQKLGMKAHLIQLEKYYFTNLNNYYNNLKKLGIAYEDLDYTKSLDFLTMTASSISAK